MHCSPVPSEYLTVAEWLKNLTPECREQASYQLSFTEGGKQAAGGKYDVPIRRTLEHSFRLDRTYRRDNRFGSQLNNRELLTTCRDWGVDGFATDPHLCHEIAETALNYLVATKYAKPLLSSDNPGRACSEILRPLQLRLPTQSWRSAIQVTYQQFSTPAPIAYFATYLLNLNNEDVVLEPSCGRAVWRFGQGRRERQSLRTK